MNILAITSSPQKNRSSSNNLTRVLLQEMKNIESDINIETINLHDLSLNYCLGCCHCFENTICCQKDDINLLTDKIKQSDFIVLASPVYFHTIPAILKNLIDRLSFWSHRIELAGKLGVIITSSHTSGNDETSAILHKFFTYLGVHTAGIINFQITDNQLKVKENLKKIAEESILLFKSNNINTSNAAEEIFQMYKEKCHMNNGINQFDRKLLIERGILKSMNYTDYFNIRRKKSSQRE